jgi:hypothetical protein
MNNFYWCYCINHYHGYFGLGYWFKIMSQDPKQAYKSCKILGYKITKIKKAKGFWN